MTRRNPSEPQTTMSGQTMESAQADAAEAQANQALVAAAQARMPDAVVVGTNGVTVPLSVVEELAREEERIRAEAERESEERIRKNRAEVARAKELAAQSKDVLAKAHPQILFFRSRDPFGVGPRGSRMRTRMKHGDVETDGQVVKLTRVAEGIEVMAFGEPAVVPWSNVASMEEAKEA